MATNGLQQVTGAPAHHSTFDKQCLVLYVRQVRFVAASLTLETPLEESEILRIAEAMYKKIWHREAPEYQHSLNVAPMAGGDLEEA